MVVTRVILIAFPSFSKSLRIIYPSLYHRHYLVLDTDSVVKEIIKEDPLFTFRRSRVYNQGEEAKFFMRVFVVTLNSLQSFPSFVIHNS